MTTGAHQETVDFLARHQATRIDSITERLVETIERRHPGYRTSQVVPRSDLWRSCHDNVARVLQLLAAAVSSGEGADRSSRELDDDESYDAARETGRRRAEQGLPLDDVLRSFRIGGRLIWDDLLAQGEGVLGSQGVREIGTRLWEVVDETSAQVAHAYHLKERALVRADEQQRVELWESVLAGRAREPGFAQEAGRLLDVPEDADFLVVVARSLDARLVDVRWAESRLAPHATAWVRRTGDLVGLVALREDDPAEAQGALHEMGLRGGKPLGVSSVVRGLARVDLGYRQATLSLRAQGDSPGAAVFDQRLPEVLLLSSPDIAARLVDRWLEPVLALPAAEAADLLATLEAWVEAGGSATRTAASVPCHRNTVLNRLRRVGELTGHDLSDDAVPVELALSLRARRMGSGG